MEFISDLRWNIGSSFIGEAIGELIEGTAAGTAELLLATTVAAAELAAALAVYHSATFLVPDLASRQLWPAAAELASCYEVKLAIKLVEGSIRTVTEDHAIVV